MESSRKVKRSFRIPPLREFRLRIRSGRLDACPDQEGQASSQAEGTSYKKLLCALFDIAILRTYADKAFYHFVYHDGIFEGLDNRKRSMLLDVLREMATRYHVQYILSVIDADLPRNENDQKIPFPRQRDYSRTPRRRHEPAPLQNERILN